MGAILTKIPPGMDQRQSATWFNDMYSVPGEFTTLAADTAAAVAAEAADNGILKLTAGSSDEGEASAYTAKVFTFADSRSIIVEALLKYTEVATNVANVAFGLWSATGADLLTDAGAGPATTASGAMFYKVDGGTVWKVISSKSTTQTITTVKKTGMPAAFTPGASAYVRLRVEFSAVGDMGQDQGEVTFWIDGKQCYDAADTGKNTPIKHVITYTSAAAMAMIFYVKSGSAASEILRVDNAGFSQTRTYGA